MIVKCIWIAMIVAGFLIGGLASLGGIKLYWGIIGGLLVAVGMTIRQYGSIERRDEY